MDVFRKVEKRLEARKEIPKRLQYGMKEAAVLLGTSERKLSDWVRERLIESYKIGGKRYFAAGSLTRFVEQQTGEVA